MNTRDSQTYAKRLAAIRSIQPTAILPKGDRAAADFRTIQKGGVIAFRGKNYLVTGVATATEHNKSFEKKKDYVATEYTLRCLRTGATAYIEWEVDDEVEISFTERKITKRELGNDLRYDDGYAIDLDGEEGFKHIVNKEWEVVLNGVTYDYDDDWYTLYESDDGRRARAHIAEFGSDDVGWLTIEKWIDDEDDVEYEVFLSSTVAREEIEIYSLGEAAIAS